MALPSSYYEGTIFRGNWTGRDVLSGYICSIPGSSFVEDLLYKRRKFEKNILFE